MYSESYLQALKEVLDIEGARSNYKWDPGGDTSFGISKVHWPAYWADGAPDKSTAVIFYWKEFWMATGMEELDHQAVRLELFEASVNCGMINGGLFAQNAYNLLKPDTWGPDLKDDGDVGPITRKALNHMAGSYLNALLGGMNYYQADYYVKTRETVRKKAIRGWFGNRLSWIPK